MKEMKFTALITARLETHIKNDDGTKTIIKLENTNELLDNINKYLPNKSKLVVIANNPDAYESNDERAEILYKSFQLSNLKFKEKILIDNRNAKEAKSILQNASLVILWGGKVYCQMKFFRKIHLDKLLANYKGLLISISAGTMNMCKNVYNFPEEVTDLKEPRLLKGLGFIDEYLIPHFDGKTYDCFMENVDSVNDYILPFSHKKDLIAIPNRSYLLYNGKSVQHFGDCYLVRKGEVYKKV